MAQAWTTWERLSDVPVPKGIFWVIS